MVIRSSAQPFATDAGEVGILFLHGFTGSPRSLREWAEVTAAAGHRVSLPRLPGHGTTWQELERTGWQDWYHTAATEFAALRRHCDRVFVAGLSMGGALALRLAERQADEVAGLALVNPGLGSTNRLLPLVPALRLVKRTNPGIVDDIALPGVSEEGYATVPVKAVYAMMRLWADTRTYLDLVTCPMVVFRSATDHIVPAASTETVLRQTSSLDATEIVLPDSYHVATMDHDRQVIYDETLRFIARIAG